MANLFAMSERLLAIDRASGGDGATGHGAARVVFADGLEVEVPSSSLAQYVGRHDQRNIVQ